MKWIQSRMQDRTGWAVGHFPWQGAAVAAALLMVPKAISVRQGNARYLTAFVALWIAFGAPVNTFSFPDQLKATPTSAEELPNPPFVPLPFRDQLKATPTSAEKSESNMPKAESESPFESSDQEPTEQILIEILVAEIPESLAFELGFLTPNGERNGSRNTNGVRNLGMSRTSTTSVLSPDQSSELRQILRTASLVNVMASPKVTTLSGQEARVTVRTPKNVLSIGGTSEVELGPAITILL